MFPTLFHIGPLTLHTYGLMVALGVIAATQSLVYFAQRSGIPRPKAQEILYSLAFHALITGILTARLFYVVTFWDEFSADWPAVFRIWEGGLVFYGGLLGGIAGFFIWKRRYPEIPWRQAADWASPSLALGHAFGRLGCFFAGCCYGRPTDAPWAVTFSRPDSLAPLGIPLHPSQIYEFLFLVGLASYLWIRNLKIHASGSVFACYLMIYSIGRFALEFFRGDPSPSPVLSPAQIASIFVLVSSLIFHKKIARDA